MIKEAILKLAKKEILTYEEAEEVMNVIMSGEATPVQMSSYLTALSLKGETIDEAFVPADLRLEDKYFWAVNYFQQTVGANVIFPMHFWGRFDVCDMLKELGFANIMKITEENESFEI